MRAGTGRHENRSRTRGRSTKRDEKKDAETREREKTDKRLQFPASTNTSKTAIIKHARRLLCLSRCLAGFLTPFPGFALPAAPMGKCQNSATAAGQELATKQAWHGKNTAPAPLMSLRRFSPLGYHIGTLLA